MNSKEILAKIRELSNEEKMKGKYYFKVELIEIYGDYLEGVKN